MDVGYYLKENIMIPDNICLEAISALDFPCYVIDASNYEVILANPLATHWGVKKEKKCYELTHNRTTPCDNHEHPCPLKEVLRTKKPYRVKHIHETIDGKKGIFEVHGCPIIDSKGNVTYMVECSLDITEQELLRQNLTDTENKFFEVEKMATMGELTASIGHEINNPITILKGYATLMKDNKISIEEGLKAQEKTIDRIVQLLQGLKTLSKVDVNTDELVDINETISNSLKLILPLFKKENIVIQADLQTDLPLIKGSVGAFQQILLNLFSNAKDAMNGREKKNILISTLSKQQEVIFRFSDDGPGIAPEHINKIFDAYFTTKAVGKGSGIGLRVVRDLTKKLKGEVRVESSPEKGAAFIFNFRLS